MTYSDYQTICDNRKKQRQKLYRLVLIQGSKCFWCDGWIALKRRLENKAIIENSSREVAWLENGEVLRAGWATIDHVLPRCKGGRNGISNLVAACYACNQDRNWLMSQNAGGDYDRLKNILPERWRSIQHQQRIKHPRIPRPCKHKPFESVAEACEFRDEVKRVAKVRAVFFRCKRCEKWRVVAIDRPRFTAGRKRVSRLFETPQQIDIMSASDCVN